MRVYCRTVGARVVAKIKKVGSFAANKVFQGICGKQRGGDGKRKAQQEVGLHAAAAAALAVRRNINGEAEAGGEEDRKHNKEPRRYSVIKSLL